MTLVAAIITLLPFVIAPGASFALTLRAATSGDRAAAVRVWAGTSLGLLLIAFVAATTGLGVVVAAEPRIRAAFEVVGGIVLIALAVLPALSARRRGASPRPPTQSSASRLVFAALVAVVTNVKALTLYLIVVPPLLATGSSLGGFLGFAAVHSVMVLIWLAIVTLLVTRVPAIATSRRIRTALQVIASLVLAWLGVLSIASGLHAV